MKPGAMRFIRNTLLIVSMLAAGMGIGSWLYAVRTAPPQREFLNPPPYVQVAKLRAETINIRFTGFGTATAYATALVSAEVGSIVLERTGDVRAGARVSAGQPVVRLDDREFRHTLAQATALAEAEDAALTELDIEEKKIEPLLATAEQEYRVATSEFERVGALFEREQAAEKEMNVATLAQQAARRVLQNYQRDLALIEPRRARVEASRRAQLAIADRAKLDVDRCVITAPVAGVVQALNVDVGDRVAPGTPVATIVDMRRVEIPIQLPAASYAEVRAGASCLVESESLGQQVWSGEVARIAPTIDAQTRTFSAYLVVDNERQAQPLVPGMFVRGVVDGPMLRDVLLVPRGAIRNGKLLVADDGWARRRVVEIVRLLGERAVVRGDLRAGDSVILSNLDILADGAAVRTAELATSDGSIDDLNAARSVSGAAEISPDSAAPVSDARKSP